MLSYVSGTSALPLLGETIGACLHRTAAAHSDREALVSCHQGVRFTYWQLEVEVGRAARGLLALGVGKGDRVGIWSPNHAEWVVTQYAAACVGAVLVNINPAYRRRELEFALRHSGVSLLVMARQFRTTDYVEMITDLVPELVEGGLHGRQPLALPALRSVIYLGASPEPGGLSWSDLLRAGEAVPDAQLGEREEMLAFDDPVNIQYTSGTTGTPKGVTLSHHNILNNGFFVGERVKYTAADRICVPVPFYHCFGSVMANLAAVTHGSALVIPSETFDAAATLRAVEQERCTSLYGVPTMFIAELGHPSFAECRLDSLRTGIMAGAPCPVEVMRQVMGRMHMPEITICYGMTETSPVSLQSETADTIERRVSTVGFIHPHLECKVVDRATGRTVPRGTRGELCTRGYSVMLGYWNDPDATQTVLDTARWMHTGDLAVMRDDGYVNIVGRLKDLIIRGGENVSPREIEEFLYTHPKVSEVQVVGVPDAKYGEEICAWVKLREGETADSEELREFCRGQIATFKIPRYIRFTTEFPMTVTGKIQKYRMRETSVAELGLAGADATDTA